MLLLALGCSPGPSKPPLREPPPAPEVPATLSPADSCADWAALEARYAGLADPPLWAKLGPDCMDGDGRSEPLVERARRCLGVDPYDRDAASVLSLLGSAGDAGLLVPGTLRDGMRPRFVSPVIDDAMRFRWCAFGLREARPQPPEPAPTDLSQLAPEVLARCHEPACRPMWRDRIRTDPEPVAAAEILATLWLEPEDRAILGPLAETPWTARGQAAKTVLARFSGDLPEADVAVPTLPAAPTPPADAESVHARALQWMSAEPADRVAGATLLIWVARPGDEAILDDRAGYPWDPWRVVARRALGSLGTADAVERLIDLARQSPHMAGDVAWPLARSRDPRGWRIAYQASPRSVTDPRVPGVGALVVAAWARLAGEPRDVLPWVEGDPTVRSAVEAKAAAGDAAARKVLAWLDPAPGTPEWLAAVVADPARIWMAFRSLHPDARAAAIASAHHDPAVAQRLIGMLALSPMYTPAATELLREASPEDVQRLVSALRGLAPHLTDPELSALMDQRSPPPSLPTAPPPPTAPTDDEALAAIARDDGSAIRSWLGVPLDDRIEHALLERCLAPPEDREPDRLGIGEVLAHQGSPLAEACVVAGLSRAAPAQVWSWRWAVEDVGTLVVWRAWAARLPDLADPDAGRLREELGSAGLDAAGNPR